MPSNPDSNIATADALTLLLHKPACTRGGLRGGHEMAFRERRRGCGGKRIHGHGNLGLKCKSDYRCDYACTAVLESCIDSADVNDRIPSLHSRWSVIG